MKVAERMSPEDREILFLKTASTSSAIEGYTKAAAEMRKKALRLEHQKSLKKARSVPKEK